jgi:hypothetical protein
LGWPHVRIRQPRRLLAPRSALLGR